MKKRLEESALHHVIFCSLLRWKEPKSTILLELHIGTSPLCAEPLQMSMIKKNDRDAFDWLLKLSQQFSVWSFKMLDALEKFSRAQKQVLREIVESLKILKTNFAFGTQCMT